VLIAIGLLVALFRASS